MTKEVRKNTIKRAFITSLPVLVGYIFLGMGFGFIMRGHGYGIIMTITMCITMYAGAGQYVGASLLAANCSILMAIMTQLIVSARQLFYGISMITQYQNTGWKKIYLAFGLTDETYSLLCSGEYPEGTDRNWYFFFVTLFNHIYWTIGCCTGNLLGAALPINLEGLDFSMTAIFVAAFVDQWKNSDDHLPAIAGLCITLVCRLIFPVEYFLIPAMIFIIAVLLGKRKMDMRRAINE